MRPLRFGLSFINFTTKTTCLGIEVDNKLIWRPQIDSVAGKFSGKLKFLKKMKNLPVKSLEEIYYKGIVPSITYCIAVWGTCPTAAFYKLESLHIKAAKIIYKLSSKTPDLEVLNIAKWKPLSYVYKRRIAAIMYGVHNNTVPQRLANLILPEDKTHKHNLRRKKDYAHIRYNNEYGRSSFRYRGPLMWNVIQHDIRNAQTLQSFKMKLRRVSHIIDSIQFKKETVILSSKHQDFIYF